MTRLIFTLILLFQTSACVYTDIKFPLDRDVWETKIGTKVGRSSNHSILWLVAWGNGGVKEAAKNGDLKVVNHLDMQVESYLFGVYTRIDTIAYGD